MTKINTFKLASDASKNGYSMVIAPFSPRGCVGTPEVLV
jgi:hypothetical protein